MTISEVIASLDAAEQHLRQVVPYDDNFDRNILTLEEATKISLAAYDCCRIRWEITRYFSNPRRMIDDAA